jgi:pSer/pThr/pTyr-binding forkhead associated (FHA) protein
MTDETQIETSECHESAVEAGEHPHAGISQEGFSSPMQDAEIAQGHLGKLVLKRAGAETDINFPVNPPCVIGRFDASVGPIDIDLGQLEPEGVYISRKHAKICFENGAWKIADLGSSNGTYLLRGDFEKVDEAEIQDGTEIALGNARFVFHLDSIG